MSYEMIGGPVLPERLSPDILTDQIVDVLRHKAATEKLPVASAMYDGTAEAIRTIPGFRAIYYDVMKSLPINPIDVANRSQRGFNLFARRQDVNFPVGWDDPVRFVDLAAHIVRTDEEDNLFEIGLRSNILANKPHRAKVVKLVGRLLGVSSPYKLFDLGCGLGTGDKMLAVQGEPGFVFKDSEVVAPPSSRPRVGVKRTYHTNYPETHAFNDIVHDVQNHKLDVVVGVDLIDDPASDYIREKAENDSFYPDEFADRRQLHELQAIIDSVTGKAKFYYGKDFAGPLDLNSSIYQKRTLKAPTSFDLAFYSFSLSQLHSSQELSAAIDNGKEVATEALIILDAVDIEGKRMVFKDNRQPYTVKVWVLRAENFESDRWEHWLTFENGRCNRVIVEAAARLAPLAQDLGFAALRNQLA